MSILPQFQNLKKNSIPFQWAENGDNFRAILEAF
jgi:hypothetical protein